jgi:hypothetical protein
MTPSHFANIANQRNARRSKRTIKGGAFDPDVDSAPMDVDLEVQAHDVFGHQVLPFPCRKTERGWINAKAGVRLAPRVVGWRVRGW